MSFIYNFFLLYPYWFIKTIIHWILQFYKNIFCLHINENKIDQLSGFEFELLVQKLLIKSGYHDVKITQASGDYGIDILAKKKHVFYGFQCKRYQKNIGVSAIQQSIWWYFLLSFRSSNRYYQFLFYRSRLSISCCQ